MRLGNVTKTRCARRRAGGLLALAAITLTTATACGLGDKTERAARIQASVAAIADADLSARFVYALAVDDDALAEATATTISTADRRRFGGVLEARNSLAVNAQLEPGKRRAAVTVADEAEPAAIFRANEIFVRRRNARETERRVWARYDIEELGYKRSLGLDGLETPALARATALAINPLFFVELVTGALGGSVKVTGRDRIGGVEATHYAFNLSFDKAMKSLGFGDDKRATRLAVFRQFGIDKDVVPGEAWISRDGHVRKLIVTVPVAVDTLRTHELTVTAEFSPATGNVHVAPPAPDETVTYDALARLVRAGLSDEAAA